jgi:hypothetical protein
MKDTEREQQAKQTNLADDKLVLFDHRRSLGIGIVMLVPFIVVSFWSAARGGGLPALLVGVMFLLLLANAMRRLLDRSPSLIIDVNGIEGRRSGVGFVPWENIAGVWGKGFRYPALCIKLKDPQRLDSWFHRVAIRPLSGSLAMGMYPSLSGRSTQALLRSWDISSRLAVQVSLHLYPSSELEPAAGSSTP